LQSPGREVSYTTAPISLIVPSGSVWFGFPESIHGDKVE
tara:strand:- start:2368 stop:2484 length:117 start_codon:yes stop_codon:yes gene_type:complete